MPLNRNENLSMERFPNGEEEKKGRKKGANLWLNSPSGDEKSTESNSAKGEWDKDLILVRRVSG